MLMLRINSLLHILLIFTLRPSYVNSNIRRQVVEDNTRGSSYGLESFIFHPFEEAKPDNKIISKRVRPVAKHKPTLNDRGQTYGLENFSVGATYDANNLQRFSVLPNAEFHSRRIPSATRQTGKIPLINDSSPWIPTDLDKFTRSSPPPETISEKPKKRVMLRKRRKRPSNSTQIEKGNDSNESRIGSNFIEHRVTSTNRIATVQSVPKVAVRNKIPAEGGIHNKKPFEIPSQPDNRREFTMETQRTTEQPNTRRTRTTTQLPSMNLKTFLKQQTETLSLSELLQTRNLTLADLIKGNRDASEILKGQQTTTSPNLSVKRKIYHKIEPTTENVDKISEHVKKEAVVEVPALRPNYNRHHLQKAPQAKPDVQFSGVQENQQKEKNDSEDVSTTTRKTTFDFRSRANELKLKLRNFQRRTQTASSPVEATSPIPPKETIISLVPFSTSAVTNSTEATNKNEILSKNSNDSEPFLPSAETVQELQNNRPETVSNLLKAPPSLKKFGKEKVKSNENLIKKPLKVPILENENTKENSEENISEGNKNLTQPDTSNELNKTFDETEIPERKGEEKDDLLELLKSEQNASKLQKILQARNMTLQEILENRARPTVQSDVAALFANHQKEISYSTQPIQIYNDDGMLNFMEINKDTSKESSTLTDFEEPFADESVTATAKIQPPTLRESKQFGDFLSDEKEEIRLNLQPNDLNREKSNLEISAVWNLSDSPSPQEPFFTVKNTRPVYDVTESENFNEQLPGSEIKLYETHVKKINLNRKFKPETRDQSFEEETTADDIGKAYIPPAVKSAIVASGVVMGIALFVFIVLFVACGWKQRQIRLKSSSSILGGTLSKKENKSKCSSTFSPDSFKEDKKFKKAIDFDEDSSDSESSTTGSYLWNTLKNTFANRSNTLKNRLEKEDKIRGDKMTLGRFECRRAMENKGHDRSSNTFHIQKDRFQTKKIDRARNVISTSFNFRRSMSPSDLDDFSECPHGF